MLNKMDIFYVEEGEFIQIMVYQKETGARWSYFHESVDRDKALRQYEKLLKREDMEVKWLVTTVSDPTEKPLVQASEEDVSEIDLSKYFILNKEEIVKLLSSIKGVKAVHATLPEEITLDFPGSIGVFYEFQKGEDFCAINKATELTNVLKNLLPNPDMELLLKVRVTDNPRTFYKANYDLKGSPDIFEVGLQK